MTAPKLALPQSNPATVWEAIADAIGDEIALIHGDCRRTWRDFEQRAACLASAFLAAGIGPGDRIAIDMYNCNEWLETFFAAIKIRAVPANVNYRYRERELIHLLSDCGAKAIVFHASLTESILQIRAALPAMGFLVRVRDDEGPIAPVPGIAELDELVESHAPAARIERLPTDQYLSYTGGTTGLPKGVMVNQGKVGASMSFIAPMLGIGIDELADPVGTAVAMARARKRLVAVPVSPIMHSTGFGMAACPALNYGGTVVTLQSRSFNAHELLDAVEAHRVNLMTIVGDALARPLLRAFDEESARGVVHDLGALRVIASAGVAWSGEAKAGLFKYLPEVVLLDSCGASEGVNYGSRAYRKGDDLSGTRFVPAPGLMFLDEQGQPQPYRPGVTGLLANTTTAVGYYNDPVKSAVTYREIGGVWCVVPGDYGRLEEDGTLTLMGRRSNLINTGGEKVHPEEVEDVLREMSGVEDCLVFGTPDERFGQRVTAIVQLKSGNDLNEARVLEFVHSRLSGYKTPKYLKFVPRIPRAPNGKADYVAARMLVGPDQIAG